MDMGKLLSMLAKMDKNDLQQGIEQANKILNSNDKNNILNKIKNNDENK